MKKFFAFVLCLCLLVCCGAAAEEPEENSFLLKVWNRSGMEISYLRFDFYIGDQIAGLTASCPNEGENFYRCTYTPETPEELKKLRIVYSYGISELPPEEAILQLMTGKPAEEHPLEDPGVVPECGKTYCLDLVKDEKGVHLVPAMAEEERPAASGNTALSFDSFDGGGPEFRVVMDSDIVSFTCERDYGNQNHEELDGAAYTEIITFTGQKPGETEMRIEQRSPILDNLDWVYRVKVNEELNVSVELLTVENMDAMTEAVPTLVITANGHVFYADLADNSSAEAFRNKLSTEPIDVEMHDYGHFEKVGDLPWTLDRNDESITTEPGDVILYQGNKITVYYDQNTWEFTRLGKIGNTSKEELLEAFGDGDVTVRFWVEWSE